MQAPVAPRYPYPAIRCGGMFLVIVGIAIIAGGIAGEQLMTSIFNVGFVAGFIAMGIFARRLIKPLGSMTRLQILAIPAAIVLEIVLITIVVHVFQADVAQGHLRQYILWTLIAVGIHFIAFGVTMGPLVLLLAALCIANATIGLLVPGVSVRAFWTIDGLIKVAIGITMLRLPKLRGYRTTLSQ